MKWIVRSTIIGIFLSLLCNVSPLLAQQFSPTVGIAVILKATDQSAARNGLIVAKDPTEYYLTRSYRDPNVAGVITEEVDFLYTTENNDSRTILAVDGVTDVWVNNSSGEIKYGDFITTSTETGIGIKAVENGAVVGYAMGNAPEGDGPHLIKVKLTLTDTWTGEIPDTDTDLLRQSRGTFSRLLDNIQSEAQEGSKSFLYIIILIIVLLASIFGFMTFGRIAVNGINAIGRNPLAKTTIIKTILINSFITILFTLASFIVALLLIR